MAAYTHSVVCLDCKRFMRPAQQGVQALELDYHKEPYILYHADLYECPGCRRQVLTGFGNPTHMHTLGQEELEKSLKHVDYVIGD